MDTIAIVDDDVYIGDMLEKILLKEGYQVLRAYSGSEALFLFEHTKPDLVLLDLMLPGVSGEEVLTKIKDMQVIVLSAKVDVQDKVQVLLGGAADYLTKPFDTKELLARIVVQLRGRNQRDSKDTLSVGRLTLNMLLPEVTLNSTSVRLTKTEYAILKLLMSNPRQVIPKSVILERISADTPDCMESSLKVHVSNLRKKLREIDGKDYIEAVWGIGFKLREDGAVEP